jgi:hypothetical protein
MSPYRERAIGIYERRLRGESWKDIAVAFGVSCRRAQQIVREHEEWLAGHLRARNKTEQPLEAIADESALDLPPTRALHQSGPFSHPDRLRMQRWWLERYSLDELRDMAAAITQTLDAG